MKILKKKKKSEIRDFAQSSTEMFGGEKVEIEAIFHVVLLDTIIDTFGRNIRVEKIENDDEYFFIVSEIFTTFVPSFRLSKSEYNCGRDNKNSK